MMRLLRAWGAAVTAFVDELSPYDFPLIADIPEQPGLRWGQDSSCAEAAVEEVPGAVQPFEATAPGQPNLTPTELADAAIAARYRASILYPGLPVSTNYWDGLADKLEAAAYEAAK
jgi:hypothetical protein